MRVRSETEGLFGSLFVLEECSCLVVVMDDRPFDVGISAGGVPATAVVGSSV